MGFAATEPIEVPSGRVAPRDALLAVLEQRPAAPAREPAGYTDMAVEVKARAAGSQSLRDICRSIRL